MCCGPRRAEEKNMCGAVATLKGEYMDGTDRVTPPGRSGAYSRAGSDWRRSLLASLRTRRCVVLMDLLGRRGGLFLDWASAAFGDGERHGSGPPVGQCCQVQRPPCLYQDEIEEVGGEVPKISRPGKPLTGFVGACYPPTIGSCVRATRPPAWPAPLVLPPSLGTREGTGLQGEGLLGCWT